MLRNSIYWANRSAKLGAPGSTIPLEEPTYFSIVCGSNLLAAAFNNGLPITTYFKNGRPTTPFPIKRGDTITQQIFTYEEGYEHTFDFALKDYDKAVAKGIVPQAIICGGTLKCDLKVRR